MFITVVECPVLCSIVTVHYSMTDLCAQKSMHFLCLKPHETDKNVLKFTKNLVLKFHFLLLGPLQKSSSFVSAYPCDKQKCKVISVSLARGVYTALFDSDIVSSLSMLFCCVYFHC